MGKPIATAGLTKAGGVDITPSQGFCFATGLPVLRHGDIVLPHPPLHPPNPVISGSFGVFVGGILIMRESDLASCLHPLVTGDGTSNAS
jgi:uncharacterized Zn-binding protein involved in type VI secretion